MKHIKRMSGTAVAALLSQGALAQDAPELDVIHWLTAGAEQAAIQVLADAVEARGGTWVDSAAPGGGADARAILMSRIAGGDAPGASFLALGPEAIELGEGGALRDLREIASQHGVENVAPVMVDISSTEDGSLYALPIGLETQNLMYYSPAAFEAAGVDMPQSWDDVIASADTLRDAGIIPVAVGAQAWQLGILFTSVVVGEGGSDLYAATFVDKDSDTAGSADMVAAFETMRALSDMADEGAANRAWNDTLNLLASGDAAFQIMGSWAGAELANMELEQGTVWDCALAPGNDAVVVEGAGFMFPEPSSGETRAAQDIFVEVLLDPTVQAEFGAVKGAVPPSSTADTSAMSSCTQLVAGVLGSEDGTGLPTISASLSSDGWGQVQDMLANFWADSSMSAQAGADQLAAIIASQN
ncbi:ABC transporter substrate-binding protein [Thalassorhabdomicrobium marinisediminis]|uniref:Probable sugar-binding periplasmic protein n=1 Tax=Thalassorhabdomicrobium marinisediminis TaxID=2170577 RepID=A0A2T7FT71_9RHOB|nr:ABC transporter substrate-binding protein [Thalassorhabdomicrobium marinisediminis]PVA05364.1 carbohydrate ABC transporter substrate-binding protein [Thalassorhabdomicrobium marinisediminis]